MKIAARLRDIVAGDEGVYLDRWDDDVTYDDVIHMWIEGNYACDCNRGSFLSDVLDNDPDADELDLPCNLFHNTGRIKLLELRDVDTNTLLWCWFNVADYPKYLQWYMYKQTAGLTALVNER